MSTFTPGTVPTPPDPLALDQPKSLGPLLASAWALWRGQPSIFLVTAALVVVPIEVFFVGAFGHGFSDPEGKASQGWTALDQILIATLGTALVTATHARSVIALAERKTLTTESALKLGLTAFGPVLVAGLLFFATVVIGVFALFVGAIAAAILGIFTTQIVALEGVGASDALRRSWALVRENGFWRTFGYQFVLTIFAQLGAAAINIAVVAVSLAIGEPHAFGIVAVIASAITTTAVISWTALVNTLLYFSWKSESRLRASGQLPPRGMPIDAGQGVSFVKSAGTDGAPSGVPSGDQPVGSSSTVPDAQRGTTPEAPGGRGDAPAGAPQPPADPSDFPYDDIPPRRPQA